MRYMIGTRESLTKSPFLTRLYGREASFLAASWTFLTAFTLIVWIAFHTLGLIRLHYHINQLEQTAQIITNNALIAYNQKAIKLLLEIELKRLPEQEVGRVML